MLGKLISILARRNLSVLIGLQSRKNNDDADSVNLSDYVEYHGKCCRLLINVENRTYE